MEAKRAGFGCVRTVDRTPLRLRTSEPVFGVGRRHVIKLYLKGEEPKKLEVKSILSLIDEQLQDSKKSLTMAILDVRRAKLISDLSDKVLSMSGNIDFGEVRTWLAGLRTSAEHRERLDLAVLLREVARRGDAERRLCRELLEALVAYSDDKSGTSYLSF